MLKNLLLINVLFLSACSVQLVKEEKYISTDKFKDAVYKICMNSTKYKKPQHKKKSICKKDAQKYITSAEHKFRDYKADEHNYRLCRSRFVDIHASDKCFNEQQEKYYRRELDDYKKHMD